MVIALNWNTVASISTAAASIVALSALLVTIVIYVQQRDTERAAQIREDIRNFTGATARLVQFLEDRSPLVSASWRVIDTVYDRLSPNPSVDKVRELLDQKGMGRTVAVVGWGKSPEAESLRNASAEQLTASRRLSGDLNALSEAGNMLQIMAQNMNMTLIKLLDDPQLKGIVLKDTMKILLKDTENVTDVNLFLAALATTLHEGTAEYYAFQYRDAIHLLNELISMVAAATVDLGARELITVARAKWALSTEESRTAAIRRALAGIGRFVPADIRTKMSTLVDEVEFAVSKEAALKKLNQAHPS